MPRKLLIREPDFPFHITGRSNNGETFALSLERLWALLQSELRVVSLKFGVEVHSFVLMPNHFHLMMTAPNGDLGQVMSVFLSHAVKEYNLLTGRTGRLLGGPYYWSIIKSSRYFGHALKYVYRNPVKAQICTKVEDYPFSTLSGLTGNSPLSISIHYTRLGMELALPSTEQNECLEWLNRPFPNEAEELIRKGLRRRVFDNLKCVKTRRPHELLARLV